MKRFIVAIPYKNLQGEQDVSINNVEAEHSTQAFFAVLEKMEPSCILAKGMSGQARVHQNTRNGIKTNNASYLVEDYSAMIGTRIR